MIIYRGIFVDLEADPVTNADEQREKRIDIIDQDSNPYGLILTDAPSGANTIYTFSFNPLPAAVFQTQIIWSDDEGLNWQSATGGTTTPQTITLPTLGAPDRYIFRFAIYFPDNVVEYWDSEDNIIDLEMTDDPLRDIVIDNAEDKFTSIRARQLEIKIYSSNTVSLNTFSQGGDTRFKVNYYIDDVLQLTAFLSIGDITQEFLPDPNVLTLIAVDGLGFLNDIPLTDYYGDTPQNEQLLLDYLLWCLAGTGHQLNLKCIFNIREESAAAMDADTNGLGHFFRMCAVDAKTFEAEIGQCENMYDVIGKIIGEEAFLFQHLGEWVVLRVDEMEHGLPVQTYYKWRWDGDFITKGTEANEANIGVGEAHSWISDNPALVSIGQLIKELRLTYKFDFPKEIPCNIDFSRGDVIDDSSPTEKTYELDCWEQKRENYPTSGLIPATVTIVVKRLFTNDYPTSLFVVIPWAAVSSNLILSSNIRVNQSDKITVGMTRRLSADVSGSGFYRDVGMQVRLIADDGTFWTLQGETSTGEVLEWQLTNSDFTTNNNYFWFEGDVDRDMTEPESLYGNTTSPPIPRSGYVQLLAHQSHSAIWNRDTYIEAVTFELLAYVNGSYRIYSGQQNIIAQDTPVRNIREKQVYISDSPHPGYKGALKIYNGTDWVLAGLFGNGATEPAGLTFLKPYGLIQAFDVWNQYNRTMIKFDGEVDLGTMAMINKYFLTDSNNNTTGRMFLLLHYEYDSYLCSCGVFLVEVSNLNIGKVYVGNSFKFITE